MIHSDGDDDEEEDDDEDLDDDDDNSPTSHQGRNSVESTSEQSLTSPAGFSSLPSIGSPAGSVASPSTPGGYEHLGSSSVTSSAGGMLGGGPDPSYWYSRPQGAFKPPPPSAAASMYHHSSLQQHAHQLQALHHYQQQLAAGGLLHRPPVGTDPRDSKNPLSISQLTGNHCSTSNHHPVNPVVPNVGPPSDSKRTMLRMTWNMKIETSEKWNKQTNNNLISSTHKKFSAKDEQIKKRKMCENWNTNCFFPDYLKR